MNWFLVEDIELLKLRMAQKAHRDLFEAEDDRQLQERMRKENAELVQNKLLDSLVEIAKSNSKPGDINWQYLKRVNPKKYARLQKQMKKQRAG